MANIGAIYRAKKAASLANPTSASTFVQSDDSTKAAAVYFPVLDSGVTSAAFRFFAIGRATTVGAHNITPKISYGVSVTAASNTVIAAATARAGATNTATWSIWGNLIWNSTLKSLQGNFTALNGSTIVQDAFAVTTAVTSVDLTTSGLGLSVELTIATGGAGTLGYLDDFTLEVL